MANIIATKEDCNGIKSGSFSSDLKRCVSRSSVESVGLAVSGWSGTSKQLVPYKHIYEPISYTLTIEPSSWNCEVGDSKTFKAILHTFESGKWSSSAETTDVTWSVNNSNLIIISQGMVTANSSGTTLITAKWNEDYAVSATTKVNIENKIRYGVEVTPSSANVEIGDTVQFTAILYTYTNNNITNTDRTPSGITWELNNSLASIDGSSSNYYCNIKGVTSGETEVTASYGSYTSNPSTLTVTQTVHSIEIAPNSWADAKYGEIKYLGATGYTHVNNVLTSSGTNVTWKSSNTNVATVDSSGEVTIVTTSTSASAIITATYMGKTASTIISVANAYTYGVVINPTSWTNAKYGDTKQFSATGYTYLNNNEYSSTTSNITWSASNSNVTVNSNGKAQITSTSISASSSVIATYMGATASASVSISNTYTYGVSISPTSWTNAKYGNTKQFSATGYTYLNGYEYNSTTSNITWSTSNSNVTVNSNGNAQITSTSENASSSVIATYMGATASASVSISNTYTYDVVINPTYWSGEVGDTKQFSATGTTYLNGYVLVSETNVIWGSSNYNIVSINSSGLATVIASSSTYTTITATYNGETATASVSTYQIDYYIALKPSSLTLDVGDYDTFTAYPVTITNGTHVTGSTPISVTWSSNNTSIATVSSSTGTSTRVTAKKSGSTIIQAIHSTYGQTIGGVICNDVYTYELIISPDSWEGYFGESPTFTVTLEEHKNNEYNGIISNPSITWESSNPNVATVNGGSLTLKSGGTTTITAKASSTYDSVKASAIVKVYDLISYDLTLTPSMTSFNVGQSASITPSLKKTTNTTVTYPSISTSDITWTSNDSSVASVSSGGIVTGKKSGSVTITGKWKSDLSVYDTVTLSISDVITYEFSVNPSSKQYGDVGGTIQLQAQYDTKVNGEVDPSKTQYVTSDATWSTSNSSVAIVSQGLVTLKGSGDATITALYSGKTDSTSVHCYNYTYTIDSIQPSSWEAKIGDTQTFMINVTTFRDGAYYSGPIGNPIGTTYTSTNPSIVSINGNQATCLSEGVGVSVYGEYQGLKSNYATVTIVPYSILLSETSLSFNADFNQSTITVTSPYDFTVSSDENWVLVSMINVDKVTIQVLQNRGTSERTGNVVFKSGTISKTLTVTQTGYVTPTLTIHPSTYSLPNGANITLTLTCYDSAYPNGRPVNSDAVWSFQNMTSPQGGDVLFHNGSGNFTGASIGTASVTAQYNSLSASAIIHVI